MAKGSLITLRTLKKARAILIQEHLELKQRLATLNWEISALERDCDCEIYDIVTERDRLDIENIEYDIAITRWTKDIEDYAKRFA